MARLAALLGLPYSFFGVMAISYPMCRSASPNVLRPSRVMQLNHGHCSLINMIPATNAKAMSITSLAFVFEPL